MLFLASRLGLSPTAARGLSMMGKSAYSLTKRVGSRNLRKFLFLDLKRGADAADLVGRMGDTVGTVSWIMQRMLTTQAVKGVKNAMWQGSKMQHAAHTSQIGRGIKDFKLTASEKRLQRIADLRRVQSNKISGPGDVGRFLQTSALDAQSPAEQFAKGVMVGGVRQFAATEVFRAMITNETLATVGWSQEYVHTLDEVYLPAEEANSTYAQVELMIQLFNAGSVYEDQHGSVKRVSRTQMVRDVRQGQSRSILGYIGPGGAGRMVGALAARQINLWRGEDQKQTDAYMQRNIERSGGNNQSRVHVSSYTRNGVHVRAHTRSA